MNNVVDNETLKEEYMISTSDNPYNPWTEFNEWYNFDVAKGYNTCSILARLCEFTDDLGDREELQSYYDATEKMLLYNVTGNYCKVFKPSELQSA